MVKRIVLLLGAIIGVTAFAAIKDYDRNGCTLGRWTHDIDAARQVAKQYGTVIIVSFMKNDGSCGVCNSVSEKLLETELYLLLMDSDTRLYLEFNEYLIQAYDV